MNNQNYSGSRYFGPNMPRQMPVYQQPSIPPKTNKLFVSSLDEAMNRPVDFNSELVYFDTNRDLLYSIYTNEWGQKSFAIFDISHHVETPVNGTQDMSMSNILKRIEILEQKAGINNVEHNERSASVTTDAANTTNQ